MKSKKLITSNSFSEPLYSYEVEVKFRPVYAPNSFGKPSLVIETKSGAKLNVTLSNEDQWMMQGRANLYVLDVPAQINEIQNVTFGWTTPMTLDGFDSRNLHVSIQLQLKPLYDVSKKARKFYGHMIRPNRPSTLYEDTAISYSTVTARYTRERRFNSRIANPDENRYKVRVAFVQLFSPLILGKMSLLITPINNATVPVNVSLSKIDEYLGQMPVVFYEIYLNLTLPEIKSINFTFTSPQPRIRDDTREISAQFEFIPVTKERLPSRKFVSNTVFPFDMVTLVEQKFYSLEETTLYNYQVNVTFQPVYSPNTLGKMSLLFVASNGKEVNVSLSKVGEMLIQGQENVYDVQVPFGMNEIKTIIFTYTSPTPRREFDYRHLVAEFKITAEGKTRNFTSGMAKPNEHQELYEIKDNEMYILAPRMYSYRMNVTFQIVYSSNSFGRMSLLFIPKDESKSINVTLSKVDEELNQHETKVYGFQLPLAIEEFNSVNFTYTTPVPREEFDTRHIHARFALASLEPNVDKVRKFYSSLAFPNEVYKLWENDN